MSNSDDGESPLTASEADELFDGLVALLNNEQWEDRFEALLDEVQAAIELGNPTEDAFGRGRQRETVRRTEALSSRDRLELLISAIEYELVVPVDLAANVVETLTTEQHPDLQIRFESDPAAALPQRLRKEEVARDIESDQPSSRSNSISREQVQAALVNVEPIRQSLGAIREALSE